MPARFRYATIPCFSLSASCYPHTCGCRLWHLSRHIPASSWQIEAQLRAQDLSGFSSSSVSRTLDPKGKFRRAERNCRERSPDLPSGLFNWIGTFNKIPDSYVLNHQSLDGFLLLRYLKISVALCFFGALITWPILFPVNATGGGGQKQLDLISFTNVKNTKNRYYAHTFVAWIYYSKCSAPEC